MYYLIIANIKSGMTNFSVALVPEPSKSVSIRDNAQKSDLKPLDINDGVPTMRSGKIFGKFANVK